MHKDDEGLTALAAPITKAVGAACDWKETAALLEKEGAKASALDAATARQTARAKFDTRNILFLYQEL